MRTMLLVLSLVLATILPAAGSNNLVESGSTLMYPLITTWARAWMSHPGNVAVETHSTGSGQGVADVISGGAQLGISDAYSIDSTGTPSPLLQIPLAISGVQVNYNLPELGPGHLNLTGDVLGEHLLRYDSLLGRRGNSSLESDAGKAVAASRDSHVSSF